MRIDQDHGWLFFRDGIWWWSSELPAGAVEGRRATDWEKFVFNRCNNRSDVILALLAPVM